MIDTPVVVNHLFVDWQTDDPVDDDLLQWPTDQDQDPLVVIPADELSPNTGEGVNRPWPWRDPRLADHRTQFRRLLTF